MKFLVLVLISNGCKCLCCGKPSSQKKQPKERSTNCDHQHVCLDAASSRVDFIASPPTPCWSKDKRKQPCSSPEKKMTTTTEADFPTLKDFILASPANSPQISKHLPTVIYLSSPERRAELFSPRNSCSSPLDGLSPGGLVTIDERDEDEIYAVDSELPKETLVDCLLASPGGMLSPQFITESDFQLIKQLPNALYMSSPTGPSTTEFFTPRDSFCSPSDGLFSPRRAANIGEGDERFLVYSANRMNLGFKLREDSLKDEEEPASSSMTSRRRQIGKPRKKVSFKSPENFSSLSAPYIVRGEREFLRLLIAAEMERVKLLVLALAAVVSVKWAGAQVHHVVGGDRGWDLASDVGAWSSDRIFRVGDKIWFTYSAAQEHIVEVKSKEEYEACDVTNPIRMYTDGLDSVSLDQEGIRYFASGRPDSCKNGLKLHVEVQPQSKHNDDHRNSSAASKGSAVAVAAGPTTPSASAHPNALSYALFGGLLLCYLGGL